MSESRTLSVLAVLFSFLALLFSGYAAWSARSSAVEIAEMRAEVSSLEPGAGAMLGELMRDATGAVRDAPRTPGTKAKAKSGKSRGGKAGKSKGGKRAR